MLPEKYREKYFEFVEAWEKAEEVLKKVDISQEAKQSFWNFLETFSKHTVNVDERLELEDLVVNKG